MRLVAGKTCQGCADTLKGTAWSSMAHLLDQFHALVIEPLNGLEYRALHVTGAPSLILAGIEQ